MKPILVKKGQFMSPYEVANIINKIESTGNKAIYICERGTSFGYNRLVVDMTGIHEMKKLGYPIVIDATHCNQLPGGNGDSSSGNSEYAEVIAKSAIAAGADALFFEVHPSPADALSDGANMVNLDSFESILNRVIKVYKAVNEWERIIMNDLELIHNVFVAEVEMLINMKKLTWNFKFRCRVIFRNKLYELMREEIPWTKENTKKLSKIIIKGKNKPTKL